jgi:TonB family protein
MIYREQQPAKPEVFGARGVCLALAVHAAFFLFFYLLSLVAFREKEVVVPIDLTVVVNENLDGDENEPPPLANPPSPPEVKTPPPPPPPPPPSVDEKIDAVEHVVEPPRKRPEQEKKKPPEPPKKPDPPKKTPQQLRQERIERMREQARVVKKPVTITVKDAPSGNGRTERQTRSPEEIQRLLNAGYRPGRSTQLAASEEQRCLSLIRSAFYAKWQRPAWTDTLRQMHLEVTFGSGGRVTRWRLVKSSGNAQADASVRQAAALVPIVNGLSADFLQKNRNVTIRFEVTPE